MGSTAWDSCSHSAVLITSQFPPLSLRKRGEGSLAGSSHAPTLVIDPEGHFTWGGGSSPSYCLQIAVECEGLDLGADVSGWWWWRYPPGSKQWTQLGEGIMFVCWGLTTFCCYGLGVWYSLRRMLAKGSQPVYVIYFLFMFWQTEKPLGVHQECACVLED